MIMLYRGLDAQDSYARERVQYRGIRIALGLMCSTPNSLGVLSSIAPLAERFVYLNFRYLVAVFNRLDHSLKRRLETRIAGYSDVLPLNVLPLLATHFVGDHM
jgi:hypothetical protein